MKLYYIMHKDFAEPLLAKQPKAARYDSQTLVLSITPPDDFEGETIELYKLGFTEQECNVTLTEILTGLANRAEFTEADLAVIERIKANGGLSPTLLTGLIDYMRAEEHTGKLVIVSKSQGWHLYENHTSFMPTQTEI